DVPRAQPRRLRRALRLHLRDHAAFAALILAARADPADAHVPEAEQVLDDRARAIDRDREGVARALADPDRAVDADEIAIDVEHRPARGAGVDQGVGLDQVLVRVLLVDRDRAVERAHDAGGDRV